MFPSIKKRTPARQIEFGQIDDGQVAHYQVGLKVGFRLEDA